ncbi:MarC family protein [Psychromonas sp. RZ22]|uniref:MarC family protein n=1 Tax=Psychromonas algarum TaxID=2555643 RepID=UPI001067D7C8|nr:MarC family protein [Psychromonas sp. RZ22]TEW56846.1 MarC family protein [Psychromonas sp. RZ22]
MIDYIGVFIFLFAVIDPIGTIPVFIAMTSRFTKKEKRKIALKATFYSAVILLFFLTAGEIILKAVEAPLSAFQIAGGIILFLFALSMIFGESKPDTELKIAGKGSEVAIFPLATPSIASPGAMLAVVLLTENADHTLWEQTQTSLVVLVVLLITLIFMLLSTQIHKVIGNAGAGIISRIMGMILASVAVTNVLGGITEYFQLSSNV